MNITIVQIDQVIIANEHLIERPEVYPVAVSSYDQAVRTAEWGTYGPNGDQPLKFVRLIDCSTEHLINIRKQTSRCMRHPYTEYITSILESRTLQ